MPHKDTESLKAWRREHNKRPEVAARLREMGRERARRYRAEGRTQETKAAFKARVKAMIDAARSVPCMDCKRSFPLVCMDFDHRVLPSDPHVDQDRKWNRGGEG